VSEYLAVENLGKDFGERRVLDGVSFGAARGEILALLGPSGGGKTTVLRIVAGLETADRGRVAIEGADITRLPAEKRGFGLVFQSYALFPHLRVGENVAFGLASRRRPSRDELGARDDRGDRNDRRQREQRVAEVLRWVGLEGQAGRRIAELSGGMQQRVAVARAVAPEPRLLLLDEPLSNLDPTLRERTRRELRQHLRELRTTTLLVTHEQEEAFEMADRIAILRDGRLEQVGAPEELYARPQTAFVAGFVGRSSALRCRVEVSSDGGKRIARLDASSATRWAVSGPAEAGEQGVLYVRPESLSLSEPATESLRGTVQGRRFGSPFTTYRVELAGGEILEVLDRPGAAREGDAVGIRRRADQALPVVFADGGRS
jgi:ABC-type Fe3+/spermidine/putrescine transport system ATPase subunit